MKFTVLQWNIEYGEDIVAVGAQLRQIAADVICLQELTLGYHADHPDTGSYLTQVLGYNSFYTYGPMILPNGGHAQMGHGIFSRYPLSDSYKLILQAGEEEGGQVSRHERSIIRSTLNIRGEKIVINTTHLDLHPRFVTTPHKQAMVNAILQSLPPESTNCILAADLNSTPGMKAAKSLRTKVRNAGPALHHPTWTTKPFHIGKWSYDELKWRIDYILYAGNIKPTRSEMPQTPLSDHLPILVEFEVLKP